MTSRLSSSFNCRPCKPGQIQSPKVPRNDDHLTAVSQSYPARRETAGAEFRKKIEFTGAKSVPRNMASSKSGSARRAFRSLSDMTLV
jgi:hypothetical protein